MKAKAFTIAAPLMVLVSMQAWTASSASATQLCKANVSPCTGTNIYAVGTTFNEVSSSATFAYTNPTVMVLCSNSVKHGTTTSVLGFVFTSVDSWTVSGCVVEGVEEQTCSVTTTKAPYKGEIGATESGNGTFTMKKGSGETPGVTVECGTIINCSFSKEGMESALTGGNPASDKASAISLTVGSGTKCPKTAKFSATYSFTAPTPLFFTS